MDTTGPKETNGARKFSPTKTIRDAAFAERFDRACDSYQQVPPKHSGRLVWIKDEFDKRFGEKVSMEAVRKWFSGEAKPRADKVTKLAQILEVDVGWLSLGIDPTVTPKARMARNAMADGAVNIIAGIIQMDGGHPAFPNEDSGQSVDLHAIIKGAKYDIHVSLGEPIESRVRFAIPANHEHLVVLGLIRRGLSFSIYEIPTDMMEIADRHRGGFEIMIDEVKLSPIQDFTRRL